MALFESIWKGQRRNLVRQDNACLFPLRKGKRFDLRERQIRKRFLCAVPNAIQIMPIEHHLQNIIVNDFDPAFMVIGKDRYTPFARPWDEPPCEHACPDGGRSEEHRVGKGCVSTYRSWWAPE